MEQPKKIKIDDVEYVRADELPAVESPEGLRLCIIRTYSAGVFFGWVNYDAENTYSSVVLINSRRIHLWNGAFTLSAVAIDGISDDSRLSRIVPEQKVNRVIEMIPVSVRAGKQLRNFPVHGE